MEFLALTKKKDLASIISESLSLADKNYDSRRLNVCPFFIVFFAMKGILFFSISHEEFDDFLQFQFFLLF